MCSIKEGVLKITSKKVRGNYVDFSISEITSKKYVGTTWKFVEVWPLTYPHNIHVEWAPIRHGVLVGWCLGNIDLLLF